jgi:putative ABC transport system permease protein
MIQDPPKRAIQFLEWFCPSYLFEGIEGDLLEQFDEDLESFDKRKANRRFWWNVLKFFRPSIITRNNYKLKILNTMMLSNYFKITTRSMMKSKLYSFINAFGLSIGMAFCMLIYLFIQDEKSFDKFHKNANDIYRIESYSYDTWRDFNSDDKIFDKMAYIQKAVGPTLKEEVAEVELSTRYNHGGSGIVRYGDMVFTEDLTYVDPDFFKMFSFKLLEGDKSKLFEAAHEAVITPEIAKKYFGDSDPINQVIEIDAQGAKLYTVTGVISPAPENSSLDYDILISQTSYAYYESNMNNWRNHNSPTFVQLSDDTNFATLEYNLDKVVDKYMGEFTKEWDIPEDIKSAEGFKPFEFQYTKFTDIHLDTSVSWQKSSDPKYSYILGGIAMLILLIACINYVSLSLTTSASRRIEVGIRKTIGANKTQVVYQFTFESIVLAFISMVIGLGLVLLFLPAFNEFTGKGIVIPYYSWMQLVILGTLVSVLLGLLAGSYPSIILSRYTPAQVLKSRASTKVSSGFAKPLVIIQYALSAFLIISSIIMYQQMEFVTNKDLGFDKEQVLVVPNQSGWSEEANITTQNLRNSIIGYPEVLAVSGASLSFNQGYSLNGYEIDGEQKSAFTFTIDPEYIPLLGIEMDEGRNFDSQITSDSSGVIVNQALVDDMGWDNPLEEYLNWREDSVGLGSKVLGVVKDYHFRSLESKIQPMMLMMDPGYLRNTLIKIKSEKLSESISLIEDEWKTLYPDRPFTFTFMDDDIDRQYRSYSRWMNIMGLATGFGILISCLGLFGLSGVSALNRTKEIGIRKVMGAELSNIFVLMNKQYVWLALIAFAIASPASWYVMDIWLSDFEFAITIGWEIFALSMLTGLIVAISTVSYHSIKSALVNPADTLKYE